ncbi:MAG: hypothetical protein WA364_02955 [Candidatus Nitrosopolaris sp.]
MDSQHECYILEGAIILLTYNDLVTYSDLKRLLSFARSENHKVFDKSVWNNLVLSKLMDPSQEHFLQISFLQDLLSSNYPKFLKQTFLSIIGNGLKTFMKILLRKRSYSAYLSNRTMVALGLMPSILLSVVLLVAIIIVIFAVN